MCPLPSVHSWSAMWHESKTLRAKVETIYYLEAGALLKFLPFQTDKKELPKPGAVGTVVTSTVTAAERNGVFRDFSTDWDCVDTCTRASLFRAGRAGLMVASHGAFEHHLSWVSRIVRSRLRMVCFWHDRWSLVIHFFLQSSRDVKEIPVSRAPFPKKEKKGLPGVLLLSSLFPL